MHTPAVEPNSAPPSDLNLNREFDGQEGDQASSVGWPEREDDLQDGLEEGDKKVQLTANDILQALHGQDLAELTSLTPSDKDLNLWMDFEWLGCASVVLASKSKDPRLDALLQTRLTGMLGVLNLQ